MTQFCGIGKSHWRVGVCAEKVDKEEGTPVDWGKQPAVCWHCVKCVCGGCVLILSTAKRLLMFLLNEGERGYVNGGVGLRSIAGKWKMLTLEPRSLSPTAPSASAGAVSDGNGSVQELRKEEVTCQLNSEGNK